MAEIVDLSEIFEEHFSDNSGAITLLLRFDKVEGFRMMELWYPEDRGDCRNTDITVTDLSRNRVNELMVRINDALKTGTSLESLTLKAEVEVLIDMLYERLKIFIQDSTNLKKSVDAKEPLVRIGMALDKHRIGTLGAQRECVMNVLLDDEKLKWLVK